MQHLFLENKKLFSRKLLGSSLLLVASLFCFEYIFAYFFPSLAGGVISLPWFFSFLLYCGLIFLLLMLFTQSYKHKQIWFLLLVWILLFVVVGILGFQVGLQTVLLYYLVAAYAEEFLKIGSTENAVSQTDFYSSDLLFFSVFVALGFSIVENFFYIGQQVLGSEAQGILSLAFGRGMFSSLLHIVATGLIALLLFKWYQKSELQSLSFFQKSLRVILCLLVGVLLHFSYNLALQYGQLWIYVVLVVGGYFLLTYLMFLSDSLYKSDT